MDEFMIMRRAIATARFAEFRNQVERLSTLARGGFLPVGETVEALKDAADANSLSRVHGAADIEEIIGDAFAWQSERAA